MWLAQDGSVAGTARAGTNRELIQFLVKNAYPSETSPYKPG